MAAPGIRTALVTGSARGIGAAITAVLREHGIDVLAPTRQDLDLADPRSIDAFLAAVANRPIDILVNNAGINHLASVGDIATDLWAEMVAVNLTAPLRLAQAIGRQMAARRWGRIVNVSSIFSVVTKERRAAYSAVKAGLNGLTRTLAVELGPHGVLVNAIGPGYVETELTRRNNSAADLERIARSIPLQRLAQPAEIARVVAFLCSEENTYLSGQLLLVDGGFTCL
jgi:3-oxoacyl-[acyl-carrier protein] reductase